MCVFGSELMLSVAWELQEEREVQEQREKEQRELWQNAKASVALLADRVPISHCSASSPVQSAPFINTAVARHATLCAG